MKAIVAVDLNWGIGFKGNLLQRIPEDMKFFKEKTSGKVVIMGRETFESLPGKEPLKGRINIVLSKNRNFKNDGIIICRSLEELFRHLERYDPEEVFAIGGESVYKQLLPYCTETYVTKIANTYKADKYFINLDSDAAWKLEWATEYRNYNGIEYSFTGYKRRVE